ncbi:carbohydrate sulfotransferase 3-like [Ylistrum balloti]|uniref:carbohydrate sulfotransferase 3-like n=1 Tax=Ylistrum balloti TaxID=509963 RepID=UPI002905924A|nr:carbohydrate sulfotransferase 3-like [Ylistrum balloti]
MTRNLLQKIRLKHLMCGAILTLLVIVVLWMRVTIENVYVDIERTVNPIRPPNFSKKMISDVLFIGYVMGGTVFPAEVLGMRPGHFYVHEPLHKIAKYQYFKPGYVCNMMNMNCNATQVADREALGIVNAVYQCDNTRYRGHLRMWQLRKIVGDQLTWQRSMQVHCGGGQHKDCRGKLLSQCSHSMSRVVSTPRLSLSLASRLLTQLPNLKIVHVYRDPRAIMYSNIHAKWSFPDGEMDTAKSLCLKMNADLAESVHIKNVFPNKFLTVFHEQLATAPEKTMQKIFDFVGYEMDENESVIKKFKTLFYENSTLKPRTWRTHASWSFVKVINEACAGLYRSLGYPDLADRYEVSNNSIPLLISTTGNNIPALNDTVK